MATRRCGLHGQFAATTIPYARWVLLSTSPVISEKHGTPSSRAQSSVLARSRALLIAVLGWMTKVLEYCGAQQVEFIIRAANHRWVEVFNERLHRWEREHLKDFVDTVPGCLGFVTPYPAAKSCKLA